jgi:hypothetical protein
VLEVLAFSVFSILMYGFWICRNGSFLFFHFTLSLDFILGLDNFYLSGLGIEEYLYTTTFYRLDS